MKKASKGDKNDDVIISCVAGGVINLQEGRGKCATILKVRQVS